MKKHLLASLAFPLLLVISCGKDNGASNSPTSPAATITDMTTITQTADRRSLVGRKVEVGATQVEDPVRQYVFWAGVNNAAIPVVRRDKLNGPVASHVRKGSVVKLSGTIRLVETIPATDRLWEGIANRPNELAAVKAAIVYIDADAVTVTTP